MPATMTVYSKSLSWEGAEGFTEDIPEKGTNELATSRSNGS